MIEAVPQRATPSTTQIGIPMRHLKAQLRVGQQSRNLVWADSRAPLTTAGMSKISSFPKNSAPSNPDTADQRRRISPSSKPARTSTPPIRTALLPFTMPSGLGTPSPWKTLIEHGANVNLACHKTGSTPLHRAVTQSGAPGTAGKRQEALEIVGLLIAAGADPSSLNKSGCLPIT